jgi:hypothetical protein
MVFPAVEQAATEVVADLQVAAEDIDDPAGVFSQNALAER